MKCPLSVTLPYRLPGMNEIIDANRSHWRAGARQKKLWTGNVALSIPRAPQTLTPPVEVHFRWYEPDLTRDPDNIMAAQKFILDAIQAKGWTKRDNRVWISALRHEFYTSVNPRVEVEIYAQG